ncbi:CvpA family protein [Phenylobacterium sp. J367]|uniref:CvpA family protein n=1 Tax=Phenylobacterium sp. J367 TaxID=2898435 RepID=UPI002150B104|nr:CvpA family protein [Phenylobacterium sp. J367]MCR5880283.1 CvpA family protein [Phenylobacterium sp. J367]
MSGVTQFDLIVLTLLAISAAVGFARGATREVAALIALVVASLIAIFGLPLFAPMVREVVRPGWLGTVAALILVFLVAYVALRLIGAGVARRIQRTDLLGVLDRSVGLLIGLGRGLLVMGALYLMFHAATPQDLQPRWITEARTWPLARSMGNLISALAPRGLDMAGQLAPAFGKALSDGTGDRNVTDGYEAPQRGGEAESTR